MIDYIDRKTLALLVLVMAVGGMLRFWGLGDRTIWLDEGFGVFYSDQSWSYLWNDVPEFEVHLPLFYSILKVWREIAGSSEAALRMPAALAGFAVIPCMFIAGRIAGGPRNGAALGLMAAALYALWQLQIELARDARPYAFCVLGMALTMIGTLHVLKFPNYYRDWPWVVVRKRRSAAWSLLSLSLGMSILLWSHNVGAIAVLVNAAFLIAWWAFSQGFNRHLFATLGVTGLLAIASFVPAIPMVLSQTGGVSSNYWQQAPSFLGLMSISVKAVVQPLPYFGFSTDLATVIALLVALPFFLLAPVGFVKATRDDRQALNPMVIYPAFLCIAIWLALVVVTYTYQAIMMPRTLVFIVPPALLLLAGFPFAVAEPRRKIAAGLFLGLTSLGTMSLVHTTERPYAPIVRLLMESDAPSSPVLVLPNEVALSLNYYVERWEADLDLRPLPEPFPARSDDYVYVTGNKGSAQIDEARLADQIAGIAESDTVWTVVRLESLFDPHGLLSQYLAMSGRCPQTVYGEDRAAQLVRWSVAQCG